MRAAVVGASGFVGARLCRVLADSGHDVLGLARRVEAMPTVDGVIASTVDLDDPERLASQLEGCDVAFYLVHSLAAGTSFEARDRDLARSFAKAASAAGIGRIVYLGGLGAGALSSHLASRQEVGAVLAESGVPTVELRAAVVLGAGGISFEMLRHITERLPVMICPRWIATRIQPIAISDLLAHLVRAADDDVPAGVYEVGGPEAVTYRTMIDAFARVRGLPRRRILDVPFLTPSLSAHWVDLVTPVQKATSHALIESLTTEVVVHDGARTRAAFGIETMGVEAAIREALAEQVATITEGVFELSLGHIEAGPDAAGEGVYAMYEDAAVGRDDFEAVAEGLTKCGGTLSWYGLAWAWRLRLLLGRLFGERLSLYRPPTVAFGATVDWWRVVAVDRDTLVLFTDRWFCGEAWLGYRLDRGEGKIRQVGALRPKGLLGVAYWRAVYPIHLVVFELMAKRQAKVKRAAA